MRYVILRHQTPPGHARGLHWDLMLEAGDTLWTWALPEEPAPGKRLTAQRLPDHRLAYLDYEGVISDGRGVVARCDAGTFALRSASDAEVVAEVADGKLRGRMRLTRDAADVQRWEVVFGPD